MKVYLSHASPSKPLVRRMAAALPPHVECWLDQDTMGAGQQFPARIDAGIRTGCDFLVVFVDGAALASNWVRREVALGLQRQRDLQRPFVVPVLLGDVRDRMHELGRPADAWLCVDARDPTTTRWPRPAHACVTSSSSTPAVWSSACAWPIVAR